MNIKNALKSSENHSFSSQGSCLSTEAVSNQSQVPLYDKKSIYFRPEESSMEKNARELIFLFWNHVCGKQNRYARSVIWARWAADDVFCRFCFPSNSENVHIFLQFYPFPVNIFLPRIPALLKLWADAHNSIRENYISFLRFKKAGLAKKTCQNRSKDNKVDACAVNPISSPSSTPNLAAQLDKAYRHVWFSAIISSENLTSGGQISREISKTELINVYFLSSFIFWRKEIDQESGLSGWGPYLRS